MFTTLRQQFIYSVSGLFLWGGFVWLLFLFHSLEDAKALEAILYFEMGELKHFPVKPVREITFTIIRFAYPVLLLLFGAFYLRFFPLELKAAPVKILRTLQHFRTFIYREIKSMSQLEKIIAGITFMLIVAERSYYLFQFPIHTDEAASYILFIQNGSWATATYYPIPNNHILQNLLAWSFTPLFSEPSWILRLPPFLLSLLLSVFAFLILKRFSDFLTAFLAAGLFSFGCFTLFLSTQGRGYILLTFLTLLVVGCLIRALQTGKPGYWAAFGLLSTLGFYTVPTYLYPFAVCLFAGGVHILFGRKWHVIPEIMLATGFALAGAFILYAPLLLVSGPEALFQNKYIKPLTPVQFSGQLPVYLRESQGFLMGGKFGGGIWFFYFTIGGLLLLWLFRKRPFLKQYLPKQTNWLLGFALAASLVVYALLRVQLLLPPPRVLFFKSFFDYLGAAILLGLLVKLLLRKASLQIFATFAGVLIFAGFQVADAEFFLKDYPQPYYNFPALVKQIRKHNARKVYLEEPFYQLFLEYEYARSGRKIQIENGKPAKNERYDYVVIEHQKKFPKTLADSLYREVYKDELVRAFVPKK